MRAVLWQTRWARASHGSTVHIVTLFSTVDKLAANLAVLQRHDPSVVEVLFSAAHVTLYQFNEETSAWQKLNVEGSLFVVRRTRDPQHQYIVMNRRSTENYVEDISSPKFAIQDADPYLMYRNATDQIIGIWFYDANERVAVAKLLRDITDAYKLKASAPIAAPVVVPGKRIDIAALMMAAAVEPAAVPPSPAVPPTTVTAAAPSTATAATAATGSSARDRLRTRLRALADDDAFLDTVLALLEASTK